MTGRRLLSAPWLAFRVVPGENPDVDPWLLESGPVVGLPTIRCTPELVDLGWELKDCTGQRPLPRGVTVTAFVPAHGDIALEVRVRRGLLGVSVFLAQVPQEDEPQGSENVSLVWHRPGKGIHSDIWAAEGLVFAPHYSNGDIELLDAKSGDLLGTASIDEAEGVGPPRVWDVKARDGLLYAATSSNGLVVFDVSQPDSPAMIGQYRVFVAERSPENFTDLHNIFLSPDGDYVYAINTSAPESDLRIIDVSDPTSPTEAGRFAKPAAGDFEGVHDVNVIQHAGRTIAFLNYLKAGLWVLDVTDPAGINVLSTIEWDGIFSHSGWVFPLDDRLYYAHTSEGYDRHLTILEVTDLTSPEEVSSFSTRAGLSIHNVDVVDGIAYISYYIDGLRVVDLRDPANPKEIGHFDTVPAGGERDIAQGAWGVRVFEGMVYISDIETGTYAFQVDTE